MLRGHRLAVVECALLGLFLPLSTTYSTPRKRPLHICIHRNSIYLMSFISVVVVAVVSVQKKTMKYGRDGNVDRRPLPTPLLHIAGHNTGESAGPGRPTTLAVPAKSRLTQKYR